MQHSVPEKYALTLKDTLLAPTIEACVFNYLKRPVRWPTAKALKAFAELYDHKDGAIRTALSRAQKSKTLVPLPETHIKRFKPGQVIKDYVRYFLQDSLSTPTFSLIIAQFSHHENPQRHQLKDRLSRLGYIKFAPNTFLRYGGNPKPVDHFLEQQQLQKSVYHFAHLDTLPKNLEAQLAELYNLDEWAKELRDYQQFLEAYLAVAPLTSEIGYLRYLYIRSAFHKKIMTCAPLLPEHYFPEVRILKAMYKQLGGLAHTHAAVFEKHYGAFFG